MTGLKAGRRASNDRDVVGALEGEADVVEALEQAPAHVVVDLERRDEVASAHLALVQVDGHLRASGSASTAAQIRSTTSWSTTAVSRPIFPLLPRKMSAYRDDSTTRKP